MSDEAMDVRVATLEREVNENLRPSMHKVANEAQKIPLLERIYDERDKKHDIQYAAIMAKLDGLESKVNARNISDAAAHARYDAHLDSCDKRRDWTGKVVAGVVISLLGNVAAWVALIKLLLASGGRP